MASTYLSKTFSTYDSTKIFTLSTWLKKSSNSVDNAIYGKDGATESASQFYFDTSDQLRFFDSTSSTDCDVKTNRVFRDNSSFYHIVISVDTTQATASNRVKIYVNGTQETSLATSSYPAQDRTLKSLDSAKDTFVGVSENTSGTKFGYFDGSMAHYHFIDGTAYDADTFGETDSTTGIWKPKTAPSVTYGTNGFFLKFENSGAFGTDSSGNGNTFTVNGTMTQTIDTPSNVFATMNPLAAQAGSSASSTTNTFSNGNLTVTDTISETVIGNLGVSQGKWFWEVKVITDQDGIAIGGANQYFNLDAELGYNSPSSPSDAKIFTYNGNGQKATTVGDGSQFSSYGNTIAVNDIIGVALNLDDDEVTYYKNGTAQNSGTPISLTALGSGEVYFPAVGNWSASTIAVSFNFGNGYFGTTAVSSAQNPDDGIGIFEYDVPAGYRALCTKSINAEEYS